MPVAVAKIDTVLDAVEQLEGRPVDVKLMANAVVVDITNKALFKLDPQESEIWADKAVEAASDGTSGGISVISPLCSQFNDVMWEVFGVRMAAHPFRMVSGSTEG
jgi:hypothetical protein